MNVAYWLGFLMADGANSNGVLELKLAIKDIEHLEQFKKDIKSSNVINTGKQECSISKYKTICEWAHFSIRSKIITRDLERWGIVPNKTGKETLGQLSSVAA